MRGTVLIFVLFAGGTSIVTAQQKKSCDIVSKADIEAVLGVALRLEGRRQTEHRIIANTVTAGPLRRAGPATRKCSRSARQ